MSASSKAVATSRRSVSSFVARRAASAGSRDRSAASLKAVAALACRRSLIRDRGAARPATGAAPLRTTRWRPRGRRSQWASCCSSSTAVQRKWRCRRLDQHGEGLVRLARGPLVIARVPEHDRALARARASPGRRQAARTPPARPGSGAAPRHAPHGRRAGRLPLWPCTGDRCPRRRCVLAQVTHRSSERLQASSQRGSPGAVGRGQRLCGVAAERLLDRLVADLPVVGLQGAAELVEEGHDPRGAAAAAPAGRALRTWTSPSRVRISVSGNAFTRGRAYLPVRPARPRDGPPSGARGRCWSTPRQRVADLPRATHRSLTCPNTSTASRIRPSRESALP